MTNTMNVIHQRRQNARTGTQNIFMEDDVYFIVSPKTSMPTSPEMFTQLIPCIDNTEF